MLIQTIKQIFLGVDGCRAGWATVEILSYAITSYSKISISKPSDPGQSISEYDKWDFHLFPTISDLFKYYRESGFVSELNGNEENPKKLNCADMQILIDIPIGLKESDKEERKCDREARAFLGPKRGSSIFRVPVRMTVYCKGTYKKASKINYDLTTKKISKQTYYLCKKIREVDEFICSNNSTSNITSILHESHPEVCFRLLSGKNLKYSKKTIKGFNERIKIIKHFNKDIDSFITGIYENKNFGKTEVKPDDVLDASVLAITAKRIFQEGKINSSILFLH